MRNTFVVGTVVAALLVGCSSDLDKTPDSTKLPLSFHATTTGRGNDFGPTSCDKTSGNDVAYLYKAPEAGRYYINTLNSAFMARISVRTSCSGAVLGCSSAPKYGPFGTAMYIDPATSDSPSAK